MPAVHLHSQSRILAGWIHGAEAERAGILFIHGLHSTQAGYAGRAVAAVDRLGAVCLTFDLGGHGASDGVEGGLSIRDHLDDATAAYDRLVAERDVDPARIGVAGASYGAYLAALLTERRPVARLALRAPALYPDPELDAPPARRTPADRPPPATSSALDALRRFDRPVLIVESGNDDAISPATIPLYRESCPAAEHVLIAEAEHELKRPEWRRDFLNALLDFFDKL